MTIDTRIRQANMRRRMKGAGWLAVAALLGAWAMTQAQRTGAVVMVGQNRMLMRVCRGWWSDEPLTQVTNAYIVGADTDCEFNPIR